ncbi:DUF1062 domain-containing protein [Paractinoplanes ferrugineus]|uniref:DUF1062 domain-containing protein n=2 Tax=Paractinoplanes ferrugineus TaxID=113564 RepID=A0A919MHJ8_9ACTN|nr:hypothetical protein Afe05nite_77430 [Actinoplanes ferrugineus]
MLSTTWLVCREGLPVIRRRCLNCSSDRYRPNGKFRINANHKLLDVWLLALCAGCGKTIKLTVLERVQVHTIDPPTLDRFHDNDLTLAAELLADPLLARRNSVTLDWADAWTLRRTAGDGPVVEVGFAERIPIRVTTLLAAGLNVSRTEVRRLIADGSLQSKRRLTGTVSADFTFEDRRST